MRPRILRAVKEKVEQLKKDRKENQFRLPPRQVGSSIQSSIVKQCSEHTDPNEYMSYVPYPETYYSQLCFNPKLEVWSKTRLHFTTKPCSEQEEVYCVDCENLVIYRHKIGQCQHSVYRKVNEEEPE